MLIQIRSYQESDARALADIYFNTIHTINAQDYTKEQRNAWAPSTSLELEEWQKKWAKIPPLVAVVGDGIVGFIEFEDSGHIDCFYCHHEWIGKGVGSSLMRAIEVQAPKKGIRRIYAEVSITAKDFFKSKGFEVVKQQTVKRNGVELTNFIMEKFF